MALFEEVRRSISEMRLPHRGLDRAIIAVAGLTLLPLRVAEAEAQMMLAPGIVRADSIYFQAGDARAALGLFHTLAEPGPGRDSTTRYEALWRAARASVTLGVLAEGAGAYEPWYDLAQEYARRGEVLDPSRLEAPYWAVAAQGRLALRAGAFEASSLAESVRSGAHAILERDPNHAGAHNALGRLYLQVVTLPWAFRQLGRVLVGGTAMAEASWEDAEYYLRRAVELDPTMMLFRVDLGRFYLSSERWAEAEAAFNAAEALPMIYPADPVFREHASRLKAGIP